MSIGMNISDYSPCISQQVCLSLMMSDIMKEGLLDKLDFNFFIEVMPICFILTMNGIFYVICFEDDSSSLNIMDF